MSNYSLVKCYFKLKTLKIASQARDCKDDLVMPPLNVYYAIFHVFKRYSQQLVIYLLQFSLWFSSILSSDSGTSSPISSISISLTCLCFRLLTSSTRSLINGSTKYCFYLEGLTSLYTEHAVFTLYISRWVPFILVLRK